MYIFLFNFGWKLHLLEPINIYIPGSVQLASQYHCVFKMDLSGIVGFNENHCGVFDNCKKLKKNVLNVFRVATAFE